MATKPVPLAVVTIDDYKCSILLPADRALKLAALMQGAVSVERDYTSRNFDRKEWIADRETRVAYETVKADAVRTPESAAHTAGGRKSNPAAIESNAQTLLLKGGE